MKLFFDENVGSGVPRALRLVRVEDVHYLTEMFSTDGRPAQGIQDEDWIPEIGSSFLVLSRDIKLLRRPAQRELLAENAVGIICITDAYASPRDMLAFVLRRMSRLEEIDKTTSRPFAFRVSLRGAFHRVNLPVIA